MRERVYIGSMLAESEMSSEIRNLLGLKHNIEKDKIKILVEGNKKNINEKYIKELNKRLEKFNKKLEASLNHQKKMVKILEEYKTIK